MIEFKIQKDWINDSIELLIFERRDGNRVSIAKPVELEFEEYDLTKAFKIKPTIVIPGYYANGVLEKLAEALDEQNVKTDKDAKIEGTLIATKYHLEDLRKLLKLTK